MEYSVQQLDYKMDIKNEDFMCPFHIPLFAVIKNVHNKKVVIKIYSSKSIAESICKSLNDGFEEAIQAIQLSHKN